MIREAKKEEIDNISKIELGSGYHKREFNPIPMLEKIFYDKKEHIFVFIEKDKIKGYIAVRIEKEFCEISLLAILKKYQKKGIAKKLIEYVLRFSKRKNIKEVVLEVRNDNIKALFLYLKYGFFIVGIKKFKGIVKLKMKKQLVKNAS